MIWKNTSNRFGAVSKGFHWVVALFMIGLLAAGLYMADLAPSPFKFSLYFWHKSFGIAVLALASLRLLWRFANIAPATPETHKKWEKVLAKAAHVLLYACMFTMPLTGWAMSSAKGFPVSVFGWFTLPNIVAPNKGLGAAMAEAHELVAYGLIGLIALHAAGALKHHIIDRDPTLRRMIPFGKVLAAAGVLLFAATAARADSPPPVTQWIIEPGMSHLTFEATQMKAPFTGEFKAFDGTIFFDPEKLDSSRVDIAIDMTSADTQNADRDKNLPAEPWFFAEKFPKAAFRAEKFEKTGDNAYIAHGKLTIRDITMSVDFPFTLTIAGPPGAGQMAAVQGAVELQRLDFNIGTGEWKDTATVGNAVTVRVFLMAHRAS